MTRPAGIHISQEISPETVAAAKERLYHCHAKALSWRATGELLGFNAGYLYKVARGDVPPSHRLLRRLQLRVRAKPTFEQNCEAYDAWRASMQEGIDGMLALVELRHLPELARCHPHPFGAIDAPGQP